MRIRRFPPSPYGLVSATPLYGYDAWLAIGWIRRHNYKINQAREPYFAIDLTNRQPKSAATAR